MIPGFLLLGSHLGNPERKILSPAQIRTLTDRMAGIASESPEGELTEGELRSLGYGPEMAEKILQLLEQQEDLRSYLRRAERAGCFPITRGEEEYPILVRKRLGGECPCCLFGKGNRQLLNTPAIALVGSRDLSPFNREFAAEAGCQAAKHGLTLISGNARGADRTAQDACLEAGGNVISIVADSLTGKHPGEHILYLSENDFDGEFSSQRALSRNRIIHTMGFMTLVAQCTLGSGGTWSGTAANLHGGWSLVVCCRDGSEASLALQDRGAYLMGKEELEGLTNLRDPQIKLDSF